MWCINVLWVANIEDFSTVFQSFCLSVLLFSIWSWSQLPELREYHTVLLRQTFLRQYKEFSCPETKSEMSGAAVGGLLWFPQEEMSYDLFACSYPLRNSNLFTIWSHRSLQYLGGDVRAQLTSHIICNK